MSYLAVVVLVENPASLGIYLLVAHVRAAHAESGVHVHIMTGHVQADQALEDDGPTRPRGAQEHQQTSSSTTISHHVQHCAKCSRLVKVSCGIAIQRIQQT